MKPEKRELELYKILLDVRDKKISPENAQIQLLKLIGNENKDCGDYRDNVETQCEYFGRK